MHTGNILGIEFSVYSLQEALRKSNDFLTSGAAHTIQYVTAPMLLHSSKDAEYKRILQSMDFLLFAESKILRAAGINSRSRNYEIEKNLYFKELVKILKQHRSKVYVLSDEKERLEKLTAILRSCFDDSINCTGLSLDQLSEDPELVSTEAVANELNNFAPDLILSCMNFPYQLYLIDKTRPFLNAHLWLGLPPDPQFLEDSVRKHLPFFQKISQKLFQKKISLYENIQNKDS